MTTVTGILRDAQQNAIPNAGVTVRYTRAVVGFDGGAVAQNDRLFTAGGSGELVMTDLIPGHYDVFVSMPVNASTSQAVIKRGTGTVPTGEASISWEAFLSEPIGQVDSTVLQQAITAKDDAEAAAASINLSSIAITGGTINGTSIGATTASTGAFTTLTTTGILQSPGGSAFVGTVATGSTLGAIIQRGSNANGEFVRFADGTQICSKSDIQVSLSNDSSVTDSFTFPASFSPSNSIVLLPSAGGGNTSENNFGRYIATARSASNSSPSVRLRHVDGDVRTDTLIYSYVAIGRWF